jgi:predicted O-methyltransferase YrrM
LITQEFHVAKIFRPPEEAMNLTLKQMKADGLVHPEAKFNLGAPDGLRSEVTFRDQDFAYRLGRTSLEKNIVDDALLYLKSLRLVEAEASYDQNTFAIYRDEVKAKFTGRWTSLSPTMERLFYMLTSVKKPVHLIELGSFWGYTLAFFAGPGIGANQLYQAERIYGIDIDQGMTEMAIDNFAKMSNCDAVELIAEDAQTALDRLPGPFDFVYIEAKSEKADDDGLYLKLLKQLYDRIPEGGWVMAHDNVDPSFKGEMEIYLPWVRDKSNFAESIAFETDHCGIELSIK